MINKTYLDRAAKHARELLAELEVMDDHIKLQRKEADARLREFEKTVRDMSNQLLRWRKTFDAQFSTMEEQSHQAQRVLVWLVNQWENWPLTLAADIPLLTDLEKRGIPVENMFEALMSIYRDRTQEEESSKHEQGDKLDDSPTDKGEEEPDDR